LIKLIICGSFEALKPYQFEPEKEIDNNLEDSDEMFDSSDSDSGTFSENQKFCITEAEEFDVLNRYPQRRSSRKNDYESFVPICMFSRRNW